MKKNRNIVEMYIYTYGLSMRINLLTHKGHLIENTNFIDSLYK